MPHSYSFIRSTPESMCYQAAAPALDSVADVDQVIKIQLTAFFAYFSFSTENIRMTSCQNHDVSDPNRTGTSKNVALKFDIQACLLVST